MTLEGGARKAVRKPALGSSWISVHQRGDARAIAETVLDLGYGAIQPGPSPRELPFHHLRDLAGPYPFALGPAFRIAPLMAFENRPDTGLASRDRATSEKTIAAIGEAADQAAELRIDQLILEPGRLRTSLEIGDLDALAPRNGPVDARTEASLSDSREAALDAVCRNLHSLCRAHPETRFCLTASRARDGLGRVDILQAIFEDLPRCHLGYWHESALVAGLEEREGIAQSSWFDALGRFLVGATISDWADDRLHLPVGSGTVDLAGVLDALGRSEGGRAAVVELDPEFGREEVRHAASILNEMRRSR